MNKRPLDIAGFLKLVIEALEAAGVGYLIGGAIAEWAWGEPRAAQALDLVVKIPINAIHMHSGLKADLYPVREGDELRQSAFQRREQEDYGTPIGKVYIHSPEDLILYKLMYFGLSQQSKHSRDITAILKSMWHPQRINP